MEKEKLLSELFDVTFRRPYNKCKKNSILMMVEDWFRESENDEKYFCISAKVEILQKLV